VKVSAYSRQGRALLVVSNLSADQPATAQVTLRGVTAKSATDALSRETLSCADGKVSVPLQPMRMRLVLVGL